MKLTRKWFTLVEMLIVIVIIGILAAALIPQLSGIQGRARDTGRMADLRNIGAALTVYQIDNNEYYSSGDALKTNNGAFVPMDSVTTMLAGSWYMLTIPSDPQGGNYAYSINSDARVFAVASISETGKKNANWYGSGTDAGWSAPNATQPLLSGSIVMPSDWIDRLCGEVSISNNTPVYPVAKANTSCVQPYARYVYVN